MNGDFFLLKSWSLSLYLQLETASDKILIWNFK